MKISPVPSSVIPTIDPQGMVQPSKVEAMRSLRMTTNATPLHHDGLPIEHINEEPTETSEATQPLSPQLALLAKQRRALQREREAFDKERASLSQNSGQSSVDLARLKSEPLSVLLENGITYEQLADAIVSNQGNSEINTLKAEIEALKKGVDQKFTDNDARARTQVLAEMQREAQGLSSLEDYELVRETRSVPKVMSLIERTYDESGEVLEVSEAMRLVEEELFNDAQRLTSLKKVQGHLVRQAQPVPQQRYQGMRTLTNRDTATVPVSAKQRALAAFYGTLKK